MKKNFKRFLAALLTAVMVLNVGPASVIVNALVDGVKAIAAEGETVYVLAGSDFQGYGNNSESGNQKDAAANVSAILTAMRKAGYETMDGFLFAGDYAQNSHNNNSDTTNGINLLTETVEEFYSPSHEVFVQGNHDYAASGLSPDGENDPASGKYGVYVIREDTYPDNASTSSHMQEVAADLDEYLDAKVDAGFSAPIFVVAHIPLHYSYRTYNNGNCLYAKYLVDVMNEAAQNGLTIVYMAGHNHSDSHDSYLGGGSYFLQPGDDIYLADCVSQTNKPSTTELGFYYMNPGYVGYSKDTADATLTMTVFEITDDQFKIVRYDSEGEHNLKSAGQLTRDDSSYGLTAYIDVVKSPYTTNLVPLTTLVHKPTGTTVTAKGISSLDATVSSTNPEEEIYSAYLTYDITVGDFVAGNVATVSVPVSDEFVASKPVVVLDNGTVIATTYIDDEDIVTFKTTHFSEYSIAQYADDVAVTASGKLVSSSLTQITGMSGIVEGKAYVIVADEGGDATLTGTVSNNRITLESGIDTSHVWYATKLTAATNANAWYLNYGSYLNEERNSAKWLEVRTTYNNYNGYANIGNHDGETYDRTNRIAANGDGTFAIYRDSRYLNRYGGSSSMTAATYNQNNEGSKWKIYEVVTGSGAEVTLSVSPSTVTIRAEETATFTPVVTVGGTTASSYTINWTTSNSNVATVNGGVVTGIADGTATITATLTKANGESMEDLISVQMTVNVVTKTIASIALNKNEATVARGSGTYVKTGATLQVTYADDTSEVIDITVGMLSGDGLNVKANGTYNNLTVTYGDKTVSGFTLNVVNVAGNNYPEYPNEGAVKVDKTATGINFQSTGIAQVELSASGVPVKKGADVIVMLDASSSMEDWCICGTKNCSQSKSSSEYVEGAEHMRRNVILEESLKNLIAQLKTPGDDGKVLDIDVAIADFSRFYTDEGSPYHWDDTDKLTEWDDYSGGSENNQVYTGSKVINADAFVPVENLAETYTLKYQSGTNYDYAFDVIYQLGNAAQVRNAQAGEERDLFVVFLSDGAPYQYNYFKSNDQTMWNNWLQGTLTDDMYADGANKNYYNVVDGIHLHRMAEAIKGSSEQRYTIIRKNLTGFENVDAVSTTYDENMYTVPGLGATMFSIAFCPDDDGDTEEASMLKVIESIASKQTGTTQYYYNVDSAEELASAFGSIGGEIAYAANNARFVDQIGDDYDLQMTPFVDLDDEPVFDENGKQMLPSIEVISYDIYTRADYENSTITADKIGDRKGTYTILETVTFNADGTEAYSTLNSTGPNGETITAGKNILNDGVIYANTFWYNTKVTDVTITGVNIPTGTNTDGTTTGSSSVLSSETFYWKLGTVQTSELAMRYYVYLDGSMEGTKEAGSYATNEYATLYYDNYLGNPAYKDTVSPNVAWKEANVSYAFYLVNENGEIIVNQTSGETGAFANKIAVTNPVLYKTVLLNNEGNVSSIDIASLGVLPDGYTLYDYDGTNGATYTVQIASDNTGSWKITTVKGGNTTYITQYDPVDASAYSNDLTNSTVGDDYTHTVVWFAVVWKVQALPDSIVVDYGLPVDISVLTNDMFGENGKLAGVGAYSDSLNLDGYDATMASGFGSEYRGTYGTAKADTTTGKVRYTLNTSNGMQMQTYEKFAYAVNYTGTSNPGYYYDTVTVIPATTIYYEDDFLTYTKYNADGTNAGTWGTEGTLIEGVTQDEDRPGKYSLTDANNIYGYDSINKAMSTFSMGQARKVHVDANSYATASFAFYGTGFDVIGMTSNTTGVIAVKVVTNQKVTIGDKTYAAGDAVANKFVNTYYGYTYTDGKWTATPDTANALYQVPVLQIEELPYGQYTVTITATYMTALDKTTAEGYDLYLDAVRIYDPANDGAADETTDTTIEDAYKADGEGWPSYIELRNQLISAETLGNEDTSTVITGLVFIDGDAEVGDAQISDYVSYGPNNEVYIAPGQRVAFILNTPAKVENVHIGIKSANGAPATYTITNIAKASNTETGVEAGEYYGAKTATVNTTTDMYYDLTGWKNDIIVISNTGNLYDTTGIISLTNIKSTYTSDPNGTATADAYGLDTASVDEVPAGNETSVYMTASAATLTLRSLNRSVVEENPEETTPEETTSEETTSEEATPEETTPEEVTTEEETTAEETTTEDTEAEKFDPEKLTVKLSSNSIKVGSTVVVTVQTGSDVNALSVNGEAVERYIENRWTKTRIWIVTVKASEVGEMDIEVVAYDADSVASEPVVETVTVTAKSQSLLDKIFGWLFR